MKCTPQPRQDISTGPRCARWSIVASFGIVLLVGLALAMTPARADLAASTFNVNSTADEPDASPGDGFCLSSPSGKCTLRAAIQETNALVGVDTIVLPAGSYFLAISGRGENLAAAGDLDITTSLVVSGTDRGGVILDGGGLDRLFDIYSPATVTISEVTIQHGDTGAGMGPAYSGGGIALSSGSSLTLNGVILRNNAAGDSGGGLYNNAGTATLNDVTVENNTASYVGGIRSTGALTLNNCAVSGNQATNYGGGIQSSYVLALNASTVSGNTAGGNGGGVYVNLGAATLDNSTISDNTANSGWGGGVWVYYQAEITATNTTISHNNAGGGLFNYHEQALAADGSDAIAPAQESNIRLKNTIVAHNLVRNCGRSLSSPPIDSLGHNLDSGNTCEFAQPTDLSDADARLGPLKNNGGPTLTHALLPGSPAIDGGDNGGCPPTDQRGVERPQGAVCDVGAYELTLGGEADLSIVKSGSPDPVGANATLIYTLVVSNTGPYTATTVTVMDTLPVGVTYVNASGDGWSCSHAGGVVTCARPSLAVGAAPDLALTVIAPPDDGIITNRASVGSALPDLNAANDATSAQTTVNYRAYLPLIRR
jgi:uncharacterized repeat protein (TIGR01451 family)/CSLREA domain-containing protein